MNNKANLCSDCNSEIITVKRGKKNVAECSYCGSASDTGFNFEDFPEFEEEE
jgi:ribosomal protein L37AE/L43A